MKTLQIILFSLLAVFSVSSQAVMLTHTVDSMDNLYNKSWGHFYTKPGEAVGVGNDAKAVSLDGSAYNFSGATGLNIVADGFIVDADVIATDPNGRDAGGIVPPYGDGNFRQLPVYSLIGIWSTTSAEITPVVNPFDPNTPFGNPLTGPFFIGTELILTELGIPSGVSDLYLFLAENDGGFGDNSGQYNVNIHVVPLPAGVWLLMSGLVGMFATRRFSASK